MRASCFLILWETLKLWYRNVSGRLCLVLLTKTTRIQFCWDMYTFWAICFSFKSVTGWGKKKNQDYIWVLNLEKQVWSVNASFDVSSNFNCTTHRARGNVKCRGRASTFKQNNVKWSRHLQELTRNERLNYLVLHQRQGEGREANPDPREVFSTSTCENVNLLRTNIQRQRETKTITSSAVTQAQPPWRCWLLLRLAASNPSTAVPH